ncbi:MAG: MotA/TolQ/ExbB proton channel family protein [Deltaproteobacteria bacterium]|nr:MotA/TolQ/ExbB proton channel family protein [Deltaproteobacteria bacterium]
MSGTEQSVPGAEDAASHAPAPATGGADTPPAAPLQQRLSHSAQAASLHLQNAARQAQLVWRRALRAWRRALQAWQQWPARQAWQAWRARRAQRRAAQRAARSPGATPRASRASLAVALAGALLFPAAFAGVAFAAGRPLQGEVLAGVLVAALPLAAWRFGGSRGVRPLSQALALLFLAAVVIIAAGRLAPALAEGGAVDLVGAAPLPLLALALYAFYLAANRLADPGEAHVLSRRLDRVFSGPPLLLSLLMAALLATALLLALHTLREQGAAESLAAKFLERGVIPPLTLFLFCWGLLMILNKFFALWWERRTFAGVRPGSVLLASFQQLQNEHSAHGLDYFLDLLWKKSTDFYTLPRYINWAIPILGFIGTVLGISLAAEGIQSIIGAQGGLAQMSADLGKAISPLGIAFDTTLIALSLSVALVLIQTALQRWEDNVLIDVEHRLRVMEEAAGGASPA